VGVASANKTKTIRVFNKKDHYNQWQFIYDPTTDRGGLLMTPNQPPLQGAQQLNPQLQNGANGAPGQNPGGLGNAQSPFGNSNMETPQPTTPPAPDQQQQ
jgi:hypothetical protein